MPEIRTKVSGVTYADPRSKINRQDLIRQYMTTDTALELKREPRNPHDANAVGVWLVRRGCLGKKRFHIGYIHRDQAAQVAALMDSGRKVMAMVSAVTGGVGEKRTLGINVVLRYE